MKKPAIIIIAILFIAWLGYNGFVNKSATAGSAWQDDISWTDAGITKDELAAKNKPVFLFITTDWCTFCKKMKGETFADPDIQNLLSDKFVNIVVDPEKEGTARFTGEELSYKDLASKLGVTGYPTSVFYSDGGEVIGIQPGYIGVKDMKQITEYIGDGHYKDKSFQDYLSSAGN
ncbi:MAG: thioredoxin fold domain-containing protein [Candidatus Zixiibacteriota bacterium]